MKKYILFLLLFSALFTSCDDAQMITDVNDKTELPMWVNNIQLDSSACVKYVEDKSYMYIIKENKPIKIIKKTDGYPTAFLFFFLLGIFFSIFLVLLFFDQNLSL